MKGFIVFLILTIWLSAEVAEQKKDANGNKIFELLADKVYAEGNKVYAEGNAVLFNNDVYVIAKKIVFDRVKKIADISGSIKIYKGGNLFASSEKTQIRLDDKYSLIEPFYVQDTKSGMWVGALSASDEDGVYSFKKAVISGCSIERPIWHMNISSGHFDSNKSRLSIWNPTIYLGDVPIFYFPYLRVSTNNERSSGFLFPGFGSSNRDGFVLTQPFYIAPQNFWDMTISPQVRTSRGAGASLELRAVNSSNDNFLLNVKYLYSNDAYRNYWNLRNKHVFGFDFLHSSANVLQKYFGLKNSLDNGIYLDFLYMNDLDYLRFDKYNALITDGTRVSKINFYLQSENHYYGLNFRYFLNLNKISNDTTFQTLPTLQYHKYLKPLFYKGLLYSVDYEMKNIARIVGYGYVENSLSIPVGIQFSLFNKWLSFGAWSDFYVSNLALYNQQNSFIGTGFENSKIGNYLSANYTFNVNMDLAKDYNKVFHIMQFDVSFSAPYLRYSNGLLNPIFLNSAPGYVANRDGSYTINGRVYDDYWNPIVINDYAAGSKVIDLKFYQYFYGSEGRELFYWRMYERLNLDDSISFYRLPLENKIGFSPIDGLDISSIISYSFFWQNFQEVSLSASYRHKYLYSSLTYYIKNQFSDLTTLKQETTANNLSFSFSNDFGYFGLAASLNLNFNNLKQYNGDLSSIITNWSIGIFKNIRCFGFGLKLASTRTPILTNDSTATGGFATSVLNNTYLKFEFSFSPLAQSGLTYRFYNQ